MRPAIKRFAVVTAFGLLCIVILANGIITRRQLSVQVERNYLEKHSRDVMLEIARMESTLKDAETGQRGFLYTSDPRYLEPYQKAVAEISLHRSTLQQLTADSPQQQSRMAVLNDLVDRKLSELSQTIELSQHGHADEAKSIVLTDIGKRTMDDIRKICEDMWNTESALQQQRLEAYAASIRRTIASIYAETSLAILAVITVAWLVLVEMRLRERHAAAIRQREEWFRVTLGSVGDAVIATDRDGYVTYLNPIAEILTGSALASAKGLPIEDVFPIFNEQTGKTVENPVAKVLAEGKIVGLANHTVLQRPDGTQIPIEDSAAPIRDDRNDVIGVVLVFRDATSDRKAQQMLRRAEKLAAAGRLAATMAHEINNPLEAVANLVYIVKSSVELPKDLRDHLELAEQQLERVSHITRQTLGFYRESVSSGDVNLTIVVESVLTLYDNKLRSKNIEVAQNLDGLPPVPGLVGELRQLISNLVSNAIDALHENGKLSISGSSVEHEGTSGVELRIADNGPGIPEADRDRIFEPFFTTKADVGTGLGLFVAREIAERHAGYLRLEASHEASGAVFTLFLPSQKQSSEAATA
jgi:PAS domain S-box-containing protein